MSKLFGRVYCQVSGMIMMCRVRLRNPPVPSPYTVKDRGVTGIFFWGGKVIFPDFFPGVKWFFPVENSHYGRPKINFCRFQKWKAKKKKKKKKKGHHLFLERFPASISNFPPFLINFHPFSIFYLPLFSRYVIKNFPVRSLWGGTLPPLPPRLLRHWSRKHFV